MARKPPDDAEQIPLLRGDGIVSSLAGAFGAGLRETRLTAMLGYLVALQPEKFWPSFGFSGKPISVALETRHALDRSDVLVKTTEGDGVIEAKVGSHDPFDQVLKYNARWKVLLTEHQPTHQERARRDYRYLRWRDLVPVLTDLARSPRADVRFLSEDLLRHLQEHRMIPKIDHVEIYARMINEESTLALFLHGRIYGCTHEAGSRLSEALYFAPCFGQAIAANHPGVHVGISYVARLEDVAVVESFQDLCAAVVQIRKKPLSPKTAALLKPIASWDWSKRFSFLFLGEPRLVFNPPVKQEKLQAGKGFLGKRFFDFDTLFKAWGC